MLLSEIPKLPSHRFHHRNSIRYLQMPMLVSCTGYLQWTVESGWYVVGWNSLDGHHLMTGRDGQIALMLWHPDEEDLWEHIPAYPEDRDETTIVGILIAELNRKDAEP